ncbi:MAG TPA: leucyl aminopeptidase [Myxococcaceae bacterium]|nr:leucyl aminopeptidase [Myxococcaceae bacterium]
MPDTSPPRFALASGAPAGTRADVLVLFADEAPRPNGAVAEVNQALAGQLVRAATEEGFRGKPDQTFVLHTHGRLPAARVVLVGTGPREKTDAEALRQAAGRGVKAAQRLRARSVAMAVPGNPADTLAPVAQGAALGAYRFDQYRTEGREERVPLEAVRLLLPDGAARSRPLDQVLERVLHVSEAANFARTLVNEPAGHLTPEALAEEASRAAKGHGLEVQVSGPRELQKLRMGMFSAVGQGSQNTPRLIEISYRPKKAAEAKSRPVSLVGKAITFDSGGLSLKSAENMADMKSDMAGSAAVLGALQVAAELAPPFPVLGYLGAAENMPSGTAYRPGDILVSRLGKTVEVTNTDAEGRLVLGDVLAYAVEQKPAALIDLATLTGACVVALGLWVAGLFSNDDALADELLSASARAGEALWRLPLVDLQKETLRSDVADMKNHGERWGGAITAAVFLREFVGDVPWAHLDIAGPALAPRERGYLGKGATGIGVRTIAEFLEKRARSGR